MKIVIFFNQTQKIPAWSYEHPPDWISTVCGCEKSQQILLKTLQEIWRHIFAFCWKNTSGCDQQLRTHQEHFWKDGVLRKTRKLFWNFFSKRKNWNINNRGETLESSEGVSDWALGTFDRYFPSSICQTFYLKLKLKALHFSILETLTLRVVGFLAQ